MATPRARRPRPSAEDLLLDGFFEAWSRADTRAIAGAIYHGHVTGAALAHKLEWTRDKVSRRTDELRSGGVVAKRRVHGWVKTTLSTEGVQVAQHWARSLEEATPAPPPAAWKVDEWMPAAGALACRARRRLLDQLVAAPGATQADLVAGCGLSQPTASRELKVLEAARLVEIRRDDGRARHHVRADTVWRLNAWLDHFATRLADGARRSEAVVPVRVGQGPTAPAEAPSPAAPPGDEASTAPPVSAHLPHDLNDNAPDDDADADAA